MSRLSRKFIAVMLLLWLPLFSGSALAAAVAMQAHGSCHEMAMTDMSHQHMADQAHHSSADDRHSASYGDCGVCHFACNGYLSAPAVTVAALRSPGLPQTPYLAAFDSVVSTPLVPPPLARS